MKTTKNIVFKTVDGVELKGDIYSAENISGPKPAVVVVHGGGWFARLGDMTGVCRSLAKAGFVAFNVTYRLAPKYHYPAPVEDLHDALEWLKINGAKYDIDPQRISGWGSPPVPI